MTLRPGDRVYHIYQMSNVGTVIDVIMVPSTLSITEGPAGPRTVIRVKLDRGDEIKDFSPAELVRAD